MKNCIEHHQKNNDYGSKWCSRRKRCVGFHTWAWEKEHGPVPNGMVIRHKCHNPKCYNLDHLQLGTYSENTRDAIEAGRWPLHRHGAKLTEEQVKVIKYTPKSYGIVKKLAKEYGVSYFTIRDIRGGVTWPEI